MREVVRGAGLGGITTLGRIERDEIANPGIRTLESIAAALGVPVTQFFTDFHLRPIDYDEAEPWRRQMYDSLIGFLERRGRELAVAEEERGYLLDIDYRGAAKVANFNDDFWEAQLRIFRKHLKGRGEAT